MYIVEGENLAFIYEVKYYEKLKFFGALLLAALTALAITYKILFYK